MVRGGRGGVAVRADGVGGKAVDEVSGKVYQSKNPKYAGHTAGPWRWEMNFSSKNVQVCGGKPKYDLIVMDFVRWGMSKAAPRFNIEKREHLNVMHRADELAAIVPGREHHADWFRNIDHPDAALIADAPSLACEVERLTALCDEMVGLCEYLLSECDIWQKGTRTAEFGDGPIPRIQGFLAKAKGGDQ